MPFREIWKISTVTGAVAAIGVLALSPSAFAAGNGYGGGTTATPGTTGGFSDVVSVQTVSPAGGTFVVTIGNAVIDVTVPPGEFSVPTQLVFTTANLTQITTTGVKGTVDNVFGIQFDQGGQKLSGNFALPIAVLVKSSDIATSSVVYVQGVNGFSPAPGWTVTTGQASGSITSDPNFIIATPAGTSTVVPGATLPFTGEPFIGMGLVGGGLVVAGGFGFFLTRRRLRSVA